MLYGNAGSGKEGNEGKGGRGGEWEWLTHRICSAGSEEINRLGSGFAFGVRMVGSGERVHHIKDENLVIYHIFSNC